MTGDGWDAIVVGARCAGAPTAMLLARSGYRVLLVDRARTPSDTMSTLYIQQPGVSLLQQWGVLGEVIASGCPPLHTISHRVMDVVLRSSMPATETVAATYAPRRTVLDRILVDTAVRAGAVFADGCSLVGLQHSGDRISGAVLQDANNRRHHERARLVVGADGMRSRVAALAQGRPLVEDPRRTCVYYTVWSGLRSEFGFAECPGRWTSTIPSHDGLTYVATYFPQDEFAAVRRDAHAAHLAAVRDTAPDVFEQLSGATQVGGVRGTGDQRNFFRPAHGPGWALAGDAGHHRDSITAQGITNAFVQAQTLVSAIGADLADPVRLDRALAEFGRQRDDLLRPGYTSTLEVARLRVSAARLELLSAISTVPRLTERYFAVVAGLVPMDELFTDELLDLLH